jgi:hypothetical protein
MSDPPGTERPYRIDEAWSRAVHARRTGAVAAFLAPHLRGGMRLIDCGCGPGSITVDLAQAVAPGRAIGVDLREDALIHGRTLAREIRDTHSGLSTAADAKRPNWSEQPERGLRLRAPPPSSGGWHGRRSGWPAMRNSLSRQHRKPPWKPSGRPLATPAMPPAKLGSKKADRSSVDEWAEDALS